MPGSTGVSQKTVLPDDYTSRNTWIVSVRIARDYGVFIYTDVGGGGFCSIYLDNSNTINLVPTSDGVAYCASQSVGAILAKS